MGVTEQELMQLLAWHRERSIDLSRFPFHLLNPEGKPVHGIGGNSPDDVWLKVMEVLNVLHMADTHGEIRSRLTAAGWRVAHVACIRKENL